MRVTMVLLYLALATSWAWAEAETPSFSGASDREGAVSDAPGVRNSWLSLPELFPQAQGTGQGAESRPADMPAEPPCAPPLPFHCVEGYGGACITPMAYLVNPGPKGQIFGLPSTGFTFLSAGKKNLEAWVLTETLFRRIELGYSVSRFGIGTLRGDVENATGVDVGRSDVWLNVWSVRALLLEENCVGLPLPALTAGVHFKENSSIRAIDNQLSGALSGIGLDKSNGVDYTLTASKTVVVGVPWILTAGMRNSSAAQLGYLGFGEDRTTTFEGSVVVLPTKWLAVGYEFRQKANPYDKIGELVGEENNWHAIDVGLILGEHMTLCLGWVHLGNLVNSDGNCAWAVQLKWEF